MLIPVAQREILPTAFRCLFCNHEDSIIIKIDKKAGVGQLSCKVCDQRFQSSVNCEFFPATKKKSFAGGRRKANCAFYADLCQPVDVYSDWVDACDAVAKEGDAGEDFAPERPARRQSEAAAKGDEEDDNDDDIMGDEDGMGGYGGDGIVADDEY